jgi:HEAT repeat protein
MQFTPTQMQNLLIEVAWYFHQQGTSYFREADLLRQLPSFLSNAQINISPEDNKAILEEITDSSSLLKEVAYKLYGFLHLTFQEYFAALAANKKGAIGWQEVVEHRHEPWWEEVILLLAECMDDATPLLLGILGRSLPSSLRDINQLVPEGEPLAVNDDLFDSDLLLAARCLVGKPTIRMEGLRDRIIAEVKARLLTSRYKFDWDRIARILVEINDPVVTEQLLEIIKDDSVQPSDRRESIVRAFGKFGNQSVAQSLLELFQSNLEIDLFVRVSIIDALGVLKANFAINILQEMLQINKLNIQEQSIEALGQIGNKEEASSLLDMLIGENVHLNSAVKLSAALKNLRDVSLVPRILEKLQDETVDWQVRWLLTESIESLPESTKESFMEMLKSPTIDERVKVGIAATLGSWGVREIIPYLCNAIENKVVPPSLTIDNSTRLGYIWLRITRTLKNLGDDSIVQPLLQAFDAQDINYKLEIIGAIAEYKPEEIAHKVLEICRSPSQITGKDILLCSMQKLVNKSLIPDLLVLLDECNTYVRQLGIIHSIAQVADDQETVEFLKKFLLPRQTMENDYLQNNLQNALYQTVYKVSKRAGVRVRTDWHIEKFNSHD